MRHPRPCPLDNERHGPRQRSSDRQWPDWLDRYRPLGSKRSIMEKGGVDRVTETSKN